MRFPCVCITSLSLLVVQILRNIVLCTQSIHLQFASNTMLQNHSLFSSDLIVCSAQTYYLQHKYFKIVIKT